MSWKPSNFYINAEVFNLGYKDYLIEVIFYWKSGEAAIYLNSHVANSDNTVAMTMIELEDGKTEKENTDLVKSKALGWASERIDRILIEMQELKERIDGLEKARSAFA
jgi:hypothetical protein